MNSRILLILNLIVVFLLFQFIENAMTVRPGNISGNGNPAILLIIPLVILFILLVYQWIIFSKYWIKTLKKTIVLVLAVISHWVIGIFYQRYNFRQYKEILAEANKSVSGDIDWEYIDSITTGLTIHVNNQYFNFNTYLMFISLSFMIAYVISMIKKKLEEMLL